VDALYPWPVEEAVWRPIVTLALAFLVPIATARALALVLLPRGHSVAEGDAHARATRVAPFRAGAFWLGLVQLQLAFFLGQGALGPAWVPGPGSPWSDALGGLAALACFLGGGVGRLVEREGDARTATDGGSRGALARDALVVRLRLAAYFAGPLVAVSVAQRLPLVGRDGALAWGWLAVAGLLVAAGVAYGGLLSAVILQALRPASERVRRLAARAAERERIRLLSVWRLPTGTFRFANAAAIPWARTMIVTDRIVELLDDDELDAVLAHEAGHLSETPWVALARVGAATTLMIALSLGPTVLWALGVGEGGQSAALVAVAALALGVLVPIRNLARRMEERADAHAREHVGAEPLARALTKLHEDALAPVVTGKKRVHPDLHDRLASCGREVGERPAPPRTRGGALAGLGVGAALVLATWLAHDLTEIPATEAELASEAEAWRRLRVDPWDGSATLALSWSARRREDLERAEAYATEAARLGVARPALLELTAELLAARGDCERARETFDEALAARVVDPLESSLELGGYRIPPTLLTECGMGEAP
jgi:Zn-dependent protease with chaperone function